MTGALKQKSPQENFGPGLLVESLCPNTPRCQAAGHPNLSMCSALSTFKIFQALIPWKLQRVLKYPAES